jgi:hypothetical protein
MVPSPSMRNLPSMSESQFKFRREEEEPLFLDSQDRSDDPVGSPAGLYLDRADRAPTRTRRREGGRFPLIIASVIVFLLAAGIAAFVLEPPALLREWVASVTGRTPNPEPPPPVPAAEVEAAPPVPTPTEAAAAAAAQEAAAAAETPAAEAAALEVAEPPPQPKAVEPPRKPKPKAAAKHKATAKAKPPARKITPPPPKKSLDLDALERSLN